jgi:hypothetical protein
MPVFLGRSALRPRNPRYDLSISKTKDPSSRHQRLNIFAVAAGLLLCIAVPKAVQAQNVWVGIGSTTNTHDYNLGTNWSDPPAGAPPVASGQSAQFDNTGTGAVVVTAGPIAPDSWTFNANSQSYNLTGASVNFSNAATLTNNASAGQAISVANNMTGTTLSQAAASTLAISGTDSFTNTSISAGTLANGGVLTSTVGTTGTGTFRNNLTVTGPVNNAATFNNNGSGTVSGLLTNTAGTTTNAGQLNGGASVSGGSVTNNNLISGTVGITGTGTVGNNLTITGAVNNAATFNNNANGTVSGLLTNTAGTTTNGGQLNNGASVSGGLVTNNNLISGTVGITGTGTVGNNLTITGAVNNAATFNNNGTVSGLLTNTAGTTTNAGQLNNGASVSGGLVTNNNLISGTVGITGTGSVVNNLTIIGAVNMTAGTLSGTGSTQNLAVNGGTFAPGNGTPGSSMTVATSLTFQAAATYMVQVNPTTASLANVTGTATLNGATVSANFAAGSYISKQYAILTATGGVSGTFNSTVVNTNLPATFHTSLSYDANDAFLNLALNFTPGPAAPNFGSGLNGNQQAVGNALIGFFNRTGGIPIVFATLTPAGLSQAAGQTATGSQQTTVDAMTQFTGAMTDPSIGGRGNSMTAGSGATPFAEEADAANADAAKDPARSKSERDAYAAVDRKAPAMADSFNPGWSVWAAGFGGSQTTDGNAVQGTNSTTSRLGAVAVGADYRFSPNTIAGVALAGGGTSFSVANGGTGRSDLFQAGAYVRHTNGLNW